MMPPAARTSVSAPETPEALLPLLSAAAMQHADDATMNALGIDGHTLMESAGRAAIRAMEARFGAMAGQHVVCCCGKGNNGGDGLVMARVLQARGATVTVLLTADDPEALAPDAARNLDLLQALPETRLTLAPYEAGTPLDAWAGADLYIDALLGTGLTSAPREPIASLVRWLNAREAPVVAVDVPTGLHSDTGAAQPPTVRATLTVAMAGLKAGLVLGDGPQHAGHVRVAEIGIPPHLIAAAMAAAPDACAFYPTDAAVVERLPTRSPSAHKYSAGYAVVVGGHPDMPGAPLMSAQAAARIGAGYVTTAVPEGAQAAIHHGFTAGTTLALPASADGITSPAALTALQPVLDEADALLIGPGLGRDAGTEAFVQALLKATALPLVLDADGLNALAAAPALLEAHGRPSWVLTPHAGEFARLAGDDASLEAPIRTARTYAARWNCTLLLKGQPSVVASPDGTVVVGATGSHALATAGSGDVLAGALTGLLAQGLAPLDAALCALETGGAAADHYASRHAAAAMVATDLLETLPKVLHARYRR